MSSKILLNLVEDILDFAKIEAGMFSLNEKRFSIQELVKDIKYIFETQCEQKRIYFRVACNQSAYNCEFNSDVGRIKQVLMNLISNAYKFTSLGGIDVTIKVVNVQTELGSERRLKITVEDTGVGIPLKDQPTLFQMFNTVSQHKNKYNSRGTGLGLTITRKLVNLLGGEVNLTSEENKGTKVSFYVKEKLEMRNEDDSSGNISNSHD